jgi:hypothetical protein
VLDPRHLQALKEGRRGEVHQMTALLKILGVTAEWIPLVAEIIKSCRKGGTNRERKIAAMDLQREAEIRLVEEMRGG